MSAPGDAVPPRLRGAVEASAAGVAAGLEGRSAWTGVKGRLFYAFVWFSAAVGILMLLALIVDSLIEGSPKLNLDLLTEQASRVLPRNAGYQAAIIGTVLVMVGTLVTVVPLAIGAAIYLEEYGSSLRTGVGWVDWIIVRFNRFVELNIQNLAAVPSIVFGILGLGLIVRGGLSLGPVAYAGSLTLALLVLPTVILASREGIRAVPDSLRQASMALGATKWQTVRRTVLPAAIPGIATGSILGMARAVGETAPLLLVGATTFVRFNPEGLFEGAYTVLPVQIFNYTREPQDDFRVLAAAGIIVLLIVLVVMNSFAIWLRNRYQRRW